jgi:hypothetical protein
MHTCSKLAVLVLAVTAAAQDRFDPGPITTYPARQSVDKVTVAVQPYRNKDQLRKVFGKTDFERLGVVPVLVMIANDGDEVLRLNSMKVELITADRQQIDPLPAEEVLRPGTIQRPDINPRPSPFPIPGRGRSSPREAPEIAQREFAAPMLPAGGREHGFFYFRLGKGPDRLGASKIYISGIREARTDQELLYFEIPLDQALRNR